MKSFASATLLAVSANAISRSTFSTNTQNFNRGMMKAMQTDMDDTSADCYTKTTATNDAINTMLDTGSSIYIDG